jgi:hypothetical protein
MVYASLQEAWGIEAFTSSPPSSSSSSSPSNNPLENPYVVRDAAQNKANYSIFQQKNQFKSSTPSQPSQPPSKPRYFVPREEDEYSQMSDTAGIIGLPSYSPSYSSPPSPYSPSPSPPQSKKIECVSMITHLQSCKLCSGELSDHLRNVFLKEFILFAGSGIMMFLFLDLLRKIAQKA